VASSNPSSLESVVIPDVPETSVAVVGAAPGATKLSRSPGRGESEEKKSPEGDWS